MYIHGENNFKDVLIFANENLNLELLCNHAIFYICSKKDGCSLCEQVQICASSGFNIVNQRDQSVLVLLNMSETTDSF